MRIFTRKSQLQRSAEGIMDSLVGSVTKLPGGVSRKDLKAALPDKGKARKAGLVAVGLAGLTAGSAGISSHRRREPGASDNS